MVTLPKESEVNLDVAMKRFGDAEARDSLVRDSRNAESATLSINDLKRAVLEGRSLGALGDGNVIPFRAVQLYRTMLSRQSMGYSQMARAARTSDDMRRQLGDFEMNVVTEEDAVFLIISPIANQVPSTMTLINDDGRMRVLKLPEPINGVQQMGFAVGETETGELLELLQDPATSIFIG